MRPRQRVYDRWWPWVAGYVVRVMKTRAVVRFDGRDRVYDAAHVQFLEPSS